MSPFREVPHVPLGPLEVGLAQAAERAVRRLPSGGRVVTTPSDGMLRLDAGRGALGTAGLLAVAATAFAAWVSGWRPTRVENLAGAVPLVVFAGLSLAAVFRALDRTGSMVVQRGEVIGKRAGSILRSLAGLEAHAHRAVIDPRSIRWLRRVLAAAADPEIAPWIPRDVVGRAELLLAREIAAFQGTAFAGRAGARGEVAALLAAATQHLDDASPARADLAALECGPRDFMRRGPGAPRSFAGRYEHDDRVR
jgi:hypothetical protein